MKARERYQNFSKQEKEKKHHMVVMVTKNLLEKEKKNLLSIEKSIIE